MAIFCQCSTKFKVWYHFFSVWILEEKTSFCKLFWKFLQLARARESGRGDDGRLFQWEEENWKSSLRTSTKVCFVKFTWIWIFGEIKFIKIFFGWLSCKIHTMNCTTLVLSGAMQTNVQHTTLQIWIWKLKYFLVLSIRLAKECVTLETFLSKILF